ncbi:protein translocase subunit SecF [uncultured Corynebacterium sp.]|uniref:protein translocase subunit SecF n=1 Tax=uncultured Corynebacterium sp. TaxID=159447 RepID=UPI0025E589DF|nr:protein translocase subunit SecF [uncultured Corynebacterium sp.]
MSNPETLSAKESEAVETTELLAAKATPVDAPDKEAEGFFEKLYNGNGGFRIVQNRGRLYGILVAVVVACLLSILVRGFSLGIDFEGGTRMTMPPADGATESSVAEVFEGAIGIAPQSTQTVGSGDAESIEITSERLSEGQIREARSALFNEYHPKNNIGEVTQDAISDSTVSESWGSSITKKMLIALGVFLLTVFLYIAFRMERDMAAAAIICLLIDLTVVSGIYALVGFEVSPATVIGLLTILAYSLYDTVVVFDKVQENTAGLFGSTRATYAEETNLAINQTIMRSINTSIFSLVPIASLLVVAVGIMGVGTLKDLALVQFIGVIAGTFSSIFFAAPLLVTFKMRQQKYKQHEARVERARSLAASQDSASSDDAAAAPAEGVRDKASVPAADGDAAGENETAKRRVTSPNARLADDSTADFKRETHNEDAGRSWRPGM